VTTRRTVLSTAIAATALRGQPARTEPSIYELQWTRLRNGADNQRARFTEYLRDGFVPACARAGISPIGIFNSSIGADTPFVFTLLQHKSMAAFGENRVKLHADQEHLKAIAKYYSAPGSPFVRQESALVRAFGSAPQMEAPDTDTKRAPRLFELRMYESNSPMSLRRKIAMFDSGEIAIFKRLGMRPVFFGDTVVGSHQPNLIYMLSFNDSAHREQCWKAFGADDEWKKMREAPGNTDAEIVSNISNWILSPAGFSPIR